jgi:hypothetical protein
MFRRFKVREHERGLLFRDRVFQDVLGPGNHLFLDPLFKLTCEIAPVRAPWLWNNDLDVIVRSGALRREAQVLDLKS